MQTAISLQNLAAINAILDDLWEGRVSPDTFKEWRTSNLARILSGKVASQVMLKHVVPVSVLGIEEATELVSNA